MHPARDEVPGELAPGAGAAPSERARARRTEGLVAALLGVALTLLVVWRPLLRVETHTLGSWDWIARTCSVLQLERGTPVQNQVLLDPVRQMQPWSMFAKRELSRGRLPRWNPYNGDGVPLIANYQSGLFSPYNLPFYGLSLGAAAVLSAAAKILTAVLGTYWFLRLLGLSRWPSIFGTSAYVLSATHVIVLQHPHAAVTALLPISLACVELVARALRKGEVRLPWVALLGLALTLGVTVLAGHPEMLVLVVGFTALYAAVRLGASLARKPAERPSVRRVARVGAALVVAASVGGAIGAVQIVPFLEYIGQSAVISQGPRLAGSLEPGSIWLQMFPNLFGTPADGSLLWWKLPAPNYQENTLFFVGALPLFLACAAVLLGAFRSSVAFFFGVALATGLAMWDVAGASQWLGPWITAHAMPLTRLYPAWSLALAVLSAWSLERFRTSPTRGRVVRVACIALAAAVWLLGFRAGAVKYFDANAVPGLIDVETARVNMQEHVKLLTLLFAAGVLGVAVTAALRARAALWIGGALIAAAQIATSYVTLGDYLPVVENARVVPQTPALGRLQTQLGNERIVFLSRDHLSVNANMAVGVHMIATYDAVGILDYTRLIDFYFGPQGFGGETLRASGKGLDLFGASYIAASSEWLPIDTEFASGPGASDGTPIYYDWVVKTPEDAKRARLPVRDDPVRQEIVARRDGLSGVVVHFEPCKVDDSPTLKVAVIDVESGAQVAERALRTNHVRRLSPLCGELAFYFEPQAHSAGRRYAIEVTRPDARAHPAISVWRKLDVAALNDPDPNFAAGSEAKFEGWSLRVGDQYIRGRIVLDVAYGDDLVQHGDVGWLRLFQRKTSPGRAWIVRDAHIAADHESAWKAVVDPSFDPRTAVVLEQSAARASNASEAPTPKLERTGESATMHAFRATCSQPAYLVLAQPLYPGWIARIGGVETPLLRANYAFSAIAIPAGVSEITLRYEPKSLILGALISAAGGLSLLAASVVVLRRRKLLA